MKYMFYMINNKIYELGYGVNRVSLRYIDLYISRPKRSKIISRRYYRIYMSSNKCIVFKDIVITLKEILDIIL